MMKSVGYKRYMHSNPYNGKMFVHLTYESYIGSGCSSDIEFLDSIGVTWLDKDWQYAEIPENNS